MATNPLQPARTPRLERAILLAKFAIVLAMLCVALTVIDVTTTVVLHEREETHGRQIIVAEVSACKRLNVVRHQSNIAHLIQWRQLAQSIVRSLALAHVSQEPERAIRLRGAKESRDLASQLTFTPLTNCEAAVHDPGGYVAPSPMGFLPVDVTGRIRDATPPLSVR